MLGYVVIGPMGLLLLAEKTRVSATLPGNHQVKTIVTSRWHKIPLQVRIECGRVPKRVGWNNINIFYCLLFIYTVPS